MHIDSILDAYFEKVQPSDHEQQKLSGLINELHHLGCTGIEEKINEYASNLKLGNLIAELSLTLAVQKHTKAHCILQGGSAADVMIDWNSLRCSLEIEHKSSALPYAEVFYPFPDVLESYEHSKKEWQRSAHRLHQTLKSRSIIISPWIGADLQKSYWSFQERQAQEELCGRVAEWLADQIQTIPLEAPTVVEYPEKNVARFEITPSGQQASHIRGHGPLNAHLVNVYPLDNGNPASLSLSEWLEKAIRGKASKSQKHPERRGALHVVGLVIDEVIARRGDILANTFLGALVASHRRDGSIEHYRQAPSSSTDAINYAMSQEWFSSVIDYKFQTTPNADARPGLIFRDDVCPFVDGIVALYYTNELQFIPNVLSDRDIRPLLEMFGRTIKPFALS